MRQFKQTAKNVLRPIQRNVLFPIRHIWQLRRWQATRRGAVVINFHGIEPKIEDPAMQPFCFSTSQFRRSLQVILETHEVVPLDLIIQSLHNGEPPSARWAALTFDDGYVNNLTVARPILHELGDLPATIFVCPGLSERGEWIEGTLIRLCVLYTPKTSVHSNTLQKVLALGPPRSRKAALEHLNQLMQPLTYIQRCELARELLATLPAPLYARLQQRFRSEDLLNWEQLQQLAAKPAIQIGGHTVNHAILHQNQPREVIQREICDCRRILEDKLQRPVEHFAYPGGANCPAAREFAAAGGYRSAFTIEPGEIRADADPVRLPRISASPFPSILRRKLACAGLGPRQSWWF